ncbi:hypothetical protein N0Y54_29670, partial [Nostoc punctiforme UO1]|uniref:hypothetical protein n=1 Tax=Nostoc punctiforme TaxID=272131 RepID=UPI0030A265BC
DADRPMELQCSHLRVTVDGGGCGNRCARIHCQRMPGGERTEYLGVRRYQWGAAIHPCGTRRPSDCQSEID